MRGLKHDLIFLLIIDFSTYCQSKKSRHIFT